MPARVAAAGALVLSVVGLMLAHTAGAEERGARRHEMGAPYRSPHWIFDDRHHHRHYYPAVGYSLPTLPGSYLSLNFDKRRFFFQGGVWFAPAAAGYTVVRPPMGIVVPVLPPAYTTVLIAGTPYFYANDTYYAAAPGGYAVTVPPAGATYTEAPAAPPAPALTQAPPPAAYAAPQVAGPSAPSTQANGGMWYYCEAAKAYYPNVAECKEGWRPVPATPPPVR